MQKFFNKKRGAFTLVEILVVILIIGLLFVFLVPKIDSSTDKARETGIKTDFRSYQTAFEAVAREHSGLGQAAISGADAAGKNTKLVELLNGYLDPALELTEGTEGTGIGTATKKDPWNNAYNFTVKMKAASNNGTVTLWTNGKDTTSAVTAIADDVAVSGLDAATTAAIAANADDYVLCTTYNNGMIASATAGFTTNIQAD